MFMDIVKNLLPILPSLRDLEIDMQGDVLYRPARAVKFMEQSFELLRTVRGVRNFVIKVPDITVPRKEGDPFTVKARPGRYKLVAARKPNASISWAGGAGASGTLGSSAHSTQALLQSTQALVQSTQALIQSLSALDQSFSAPVHHAVTTPPGTSFSATDPTNAVMLVTSNSSAQSVQSANNATSSTSINALVSSPSSIPVPTAA